MLQSYKFIDYFFNITNSKDYIVQMVLDKNIPNPLRQVINRNRLNTDKNRISVNKDRIRLYKMLKIMKSYIKSSEIKTIYVNVTENGVWFSVAPPMTEKQKHVTINSFKTRCYIHPTDDLGKRIHIMGYDEIPKNNVNRKYLLPPLTRKTKPQRHDAIYFYSDDTVGLIAAREVTATLPCYLYPDDTVSYITSYLRQHLNIALQEREKLIDIAENFSKNDDIKIYLNDTKTVQILNKLEDNVVNSLLSKIAQFHGKLRSYMQENTITDDVVYYSIARYQKRINMLFIEIVRLLNKYSINIDTY